MTSLETRPFTASSSWNTEVSADATFTKLNWPTSTGYNYSVAWSSYSPSVYVASSSDPLVQVSHPPGWGYPGGTVSVHMPAAANGAAGTDGELIVIDGDVAYNFWQFNRTSNTTASAASFAAENVVTGDGWGSKSPFLAAGITAAGASQLGGLIVADEVKDGSIDHALQLAVDFGLAKPGAVGQAISSDGGSASGIVQEGQHLAIPPGTPMPAGLSALGQQVFKAMQQYGAYVIDVAGGTTNVRAQANAFDDATMTALWHDMGNITPLLQAVSGGSGSGSTGGSSGGTVTEPPTTTPPVVVNPPTTEPPVTNPPAAGDSTRPSVQWVAANGPGVTNGTGTVHAGDTVYLTLKLSEAVTVSGTPTLSLNDKGTAKYVSGAGTDTLQFEYKVAAGASAADLEISGYNLSGVKDKAGNAIDVSDAPHQPAGTLVVDTKAPSDTTTPTVQWIAANGSGLTNGNGSVSAGDTVRLSVNFNEVMTVNGTPTLSLNSKGTAKYVSGSGTDTLQFDYKVAAGEKASDLAVTGYNLNGVTDQAGNIVDLSGAPHQPAGTLIVDTKVPTDGTAPEVQWIAANGSGIRNGHGSVNAGDTVRLSVNFNEVMTVDGTPTLSLNSKGTAKYVSGSGTNTLQFDYKVAAGEKASDLEVSGYNLRGVTDRAGNAVNVDGAPHQPGGVLAVGAKATTGGSGPEVQWIAANGSGIHNGHGTVGAGDTVWLSVNFKDVMTVDGKPTLSLNSSGTASYVSGSGTNTLQFKYVVGAGESATDLEVSGYNLDGVTDRAGRAVNVDGAPHQPGGVLAVAGGGRSSSATDFSFGNRQTVGYPGAQDNVAAPASSDGSAMSKLALLDQYAASSFATPASTSTGSSQGLWNNTAQTLAKPQA
ncbi:hypothetical protein [Bosea sp. AS-1]|uniref:hypothetical protein n=1 Tax=Bosea sp. AS-1 TaxID=2015316 RepID=UPI0012FD8D7F|nr:hypothetical protein [Bosea sp. AS-1]